MLFSSSNLFRELGTTYSSPDLGSHNTKYKIIISSQEFYRHYFYCLVTCKASLGSPFAKQAGMQLSEVLVLVHVLLISVNPLHTVPSGFFLMHGTDRMKVVSLKQRSAAVWTDSNTSLIPNWESKASVQFTFHCLVLRTLFTTEFIIFNYPAPTLIHVICPRKMRALVCIKALLLCTFQFSQKALALMSS